MMVGLSASGLQRSPFLGSILQSHKQKLGHIQEGSTFEPLGSYLVRDGKPGVHYPKV